MALVCLLLFVAGRCLVPMDETDLFFNLRLGEVVLSTERVPTTNLLSFTHPDAPDVNLAWLFQIVLALVHRAGGIPATVLFKTALVTATWAVLYLVARRRGAHPAAAALVLALAAWAAEPRFVERPHLVTFLGLALLLLALERGGATALARPRRLLVLLPAALLWANANSCFFLAPAILALYGAGALIERQRREAAAALILAAVLAPLIFATPSGTGALRYLANHFQMPTVRPLEEYRTARWPLDGPFFFLAAGVVLGALTRRIPPRWLLPLLALGALGSRRIRFVAEFALLAAPALSAALARLPAPGIAPPAQRWPQVAVGLAIAALALVPRARAAASGGRWMDLGLEPGLVPFAAIEFVERHGLRGRMYNDLEVGSYLTWRGWPGHRVFQDPRINGYPDEFHAVLRRPDLTRAEWQALLDRFGVDAALITYPGVNPRGALFAPETWALVYRSGEALVFTRRLPGRAALVADAEIPLTFGYTAQTGLEPRPLAEPPPGSPVARCEWMRRLGQTHQALLDDTQALVAYEEALAPPVCLDTTAREETWRAIGAAALRLGDPRRALAALSGLRDTVARTNRGLALVALGRPADALGELDGVLADVPDNDEALFGRGLALQALDRIGAAVEAYRTLLSRAPHHLAAPAARQRLRALGHPEAAAPAKR